jgi:hypothetical protein
MNLSYELPNHYLPLALMAATSRTIGCGYSEQQEIASKKHISPLLI